jgi:hypothetical protein
MTFSKTSLHAEKRGLIKKKAAILFLKENIFPDPKGYAKRYAKRWSYLPLVTPFCCRRLREALREALVLSPLGHAFLL